MAKLFDEITPELRDFIARQPLFFVATAPLAEAGHVNLSPKGLDTFRVLGPRSVAYLDLTGSGNETAAHLLENGRITFLFCAFSGAPKILRLYGRGRVVLPDAPGWEALRGHFPDYPGARQVVLAEITRVQTSCGYAVPRMEMVEQRDTLLRWAEAKEDTLPAYRREKNAASIDGLPAPLGAGEAASGP
ncbi:MAG TPA: pyridoxamine 5'-phosphate oxidase family protein [Longimicrobiaceae bacterium]|nr:pyridoxamine 5'-phosphate oxidase family protein [Longimicrobiaceae bacterium]